jgi:nicotinate-nucleotide adenylyltransferase
MIVETPHEDPIRLAVYGGSFNPFHWGHLAIAEAALEELKLDHIVFVPAAQSPFKPNQRLASDAARLRMLRLGLHGRPKFSVDDWELRQGGISYSVATLREYRRRFPKAELFYLIGGDHIPTLTKWKEAEALAELATFIAAPRPGQSHIPLPPPFQGTWLEGFHLDISASQIRDRIRSGLPVDFLAPPMVVEAIHEMRLYL